MPSIQYQLFSGLMGKIPLRARIQLLYFRKFAQFANLNQPVTFNEKVNYRKLYDRTPLLVTAAGKLESKEHIGKVAPELYVPNTCWAGIDITEQIYKALPDDYAFKANHTSQTIELIRGGKHLSLARMQELSRKWLKHDQSKSLGEWAYQDVKKAVLVEEFLDFGGRSPDDYKFFVYAGKVRFIQLDHDRFRNHRRNMFTRDWEDLGFEYGHPRVNPAPLAPEFLPRMIESAEKIGRDFDFIRVDLYRYKDKNAFGELTVYPGAGFEKFPSKKWDVELGKHWKVQ